MTENRFKVGSMYFIGGYYDPERTLPREIKPVIYLGKEDVSVPERISVFKFEDLEAWTDRSGAGSPDPENVHEIEGPPGTKLAMSLKDLIEDLQKLQGRLG